MGITSVERQTNEKPQKLLWYFGRLVQKEVAFASYTMTRDEKSIFFENP